jgi:hypothetical protein
MQLSASLLPASHEAGSWIWLPTENAAEHVPAKVVSSFNAGEAGVVVVLGQTKQTTLTPAQTKKLQACDSEVRVCSVMRIV